MLQKGYDLKLIKNPLLNFFYELNPETGEIRSVNRKGKPITPCQTAWYKDLRFRVFDTGLVVIDGSLHKYWNNGEHNYNDFNIQNVKSVLRDLLDTFYINPCHAIITQLEVGVNIELPYPLSKVLQNLFFHKKEPFQWSQTRSEGNYYQAVHQLYRIKIYDKSLQYKHHFKMERELLRVEINFQGAQVRRLYKLHTITDLMATPFSEFIKTLKSEVLSILYFDFTIIHHSIRVQKYANRNFWKNLIDAKRTSTYEKHKRILKDYSENYSENVLTQLANTMEEKSNELSFGGRAINDLGIDIITLPKETERTCLVTGFGISMQKSNSRFLSSIGVEYYMKFNYKVFQSLEQRFIPRKGKKKVHEKELITQIAHNIRKYYNRYRYIDPQQLEISY